MLPFNYPVLGIRAYSVVSFSGDLGLFSAKIKVCRPHSIRPRTEQELVEPKSHGFWVIEWPPYSPGLSPIEHAWNLFKKNLFELYPQLYQEEGQRLIGSILKSILWLLGKTSPRG